MNLDDVDENDGDRIVGHVFGDQRGQVVRQLGTTGGASTTSDLMGKLLPILAPIVMAYLAKRLGGGAAAGGQSGGIGDLLGSVLGGMAGQQGGQQQGSRAGWAGCSAARSATSWAACSAAAAAPDPVTHRPADAHRCTVTPVATGATASLTVRRPGGAVTAPRGYGSAGQQPLLPHRFHEVGEQAVPRGGRV